MEGLIFCPNCTRFIGSGDQCGACGWARPAAPETKVEPGWTTRLPVGERTARTSPFPSRFTISDDYLIVPTAEGEIYALDLESGVIRWQRQIDKEGSLRTPSAVPWQSALLIGAENLANLPTYKRRLLAWDARTGRDLWNWQTRGDNLSVPVVQGDTAFVASSEPKLYALELNTRQVHWSAETPAWSPEPVGGARGVLVVPSRGPSVTAVSDRDGRALWSFCAEDQEMETLHQSPAVSDETAFLAGWGQRLYAVDLETGKLRWKFTAERGITSPAVLAGDALIFGVKDYRLEDGARKPGYSLYALDTATGNTRWKFATGKHVYTVPVVVGNTVLFGADDHRLHAIHVDTGQEIWQHAAIDMVRSGPLATGERIIFGDAAGTITCLIRRVPVSEQEAGTPELKHAAQLALDGQFETAARVYRSQDRPLFAAALYLEAGLPGAAAEIYTEIQEWDRALAALREAGDRSAEGALLARMGKHSEAAAVLEQIGDTEMAAREYVAAGRAGYAAKLLWNAGQRKEAADLFRSIHQDEQAAEILVEDGRFDEAAQVYRQLGKLAEAASVYAQGGLLAEAARSNEELGQWRTAAKQYADSGETENALRLYERLEDWQQVAALAQTVGAIEQQAAALERMGMGEQAAELYERAGKPEKALELYESLNRWEKAAVLAGSLELWARQAENLAHTGLAVQAAESYQRAALTLQQKDPSAVEALADLYEAAARCYSEAALWQQYETAWDHVCRLRRWPNVKGTIALPTDVIQGEYCLANLTLTNKGYGPARNIQVTRVSQKFQLDITETMIGIRLLGAQQERMMAITIMPSPNVIGQVILRITLRYKDNWGNEHEAVLEDRVRVLGRDEKLRVLESTPLPGDITVDFAADINLSKLRNGLIEYFSEDDLQDLCFDLRIDYETLPGEAKTGKARELILFMGRHGRLKELLDLCRLKRPKADW